MEQDRRLADDLAAEFASKMASVLQAMTGEGCACRLRTGPAPAPSAGQELLTWAQRFDLGNTFYAGVQFPVALLRGVGDLTLQAAGLEQSEDAEKLSTFLELLQQAFSSFAQALTVRLKREVLLTDSREDAEIPEGARECSLDLHFPAHSELSGTFQFFVSADLIDYCQKMQDADRKVASPPKAPNSAVAVAVDSKAASSKTFDLLLEVEMPVAVSFGRAQMKLKEVIKLTTGSIVELNRTVVDPVEIMVNNCVIARGEVVVVDGNYGVLVREIISKQERLRTLF